MELPEASVLNSVDVAEAGCPLLESEAGSSVLELSVLSGTLLLLPVLSATLLLFPVLSATLLLLLVRSGTLLLLPESF